MAEDINDLPLYDAIAKNSHLSDLWVGSLSTLVQTLQGYMSKYGMFIPALTTDQRDEIQSPVNGQWIMNTDLNAPQFYRILPDKTAKWMTVTFT